MCYFRRSGGGVGVIEAVNCSVGAEANDTEHVDRRLAGVFIICGRGNYEASGGGCGRRVRRWNQLMAADGMASDGVS